MIDATAFRDWEERRHDLVAANYRDFFAPITANAIQPLLDAVQIRAGERLLDVACGPGHVAHAAAARGALVCGIDISARMLELARAALPTAEFHRADACALPFQTAHFNAVVSNFGLGHFPAPEAAAAECVRVLKPGGHIAFTWWDDGQRNRTQGTLMQAMRAAGAGPPPEVPEGQPVHRFANDAELTALCAGAGCAGITVASHCAVHKLPSLDYWWHGALRSLARTGALIGGQTAEMQARIRAEFERLAAPYATGDGLLVPIAFKLVRGRKA
jgi:SAM-dependent methyltransferase